jgi:outer membrane protein, multidrug efflux system
MNRITTSWCLPLGIFLCLTGCATMAPQYTQPSAPVPATWPSGSAYHKGAEPATAPAVDELSWREFFLDPQLQQLIALALENNRDLRVAALNIERARAQYRIQRAELLPDIDATGSASRQRLPADLSSSGESMISSTYSVGLGVSSYELDLFGRVRSLKDQALEYYFSTEQARRAVQISLVSEMASAYLNLVADREQLRLAQETLKSHRTTYDLTDRRFKAGVSSELELRQAQTSVDSARVDIAGDTRLVAEDENALRLLIGTDLPSNLTTSDAMETVGTLKKISAGASSETLQQRPDILQAENLLKSYNANIGAARAAFFPRIVLVGSAGTASADLSGLFKDGSATWTFAPQITLPIFDAGRNRANLRVAETDRDIALTQYEKTIQSAFREVADALAQRGTIDEQLDAQQSLVAATARSHQLSEARYFKGVDSFLNVLDAQRTFYSAQQNLIDFRLARLTNQVTLYKVLGGGAM